MAKLAKFQLYGWIVVPVVAGSSPVSHPIKISQFSAFLSEKGHFLKKWCPFTFLPHYPVFYPFLPVLDVLFGQISASRQKGKTLSGAHYPRPFVEHGAAVWRFPAHSGGAGIAAPGTDGGDMIFC